MFIKKKYLSTVMAFLTLTQVQAAYASDQFEDPHKKEHGGQIFHMFRFESDYGIGTNDPVGSWDFDGWMGSDENKIWLKSEGEVDGGDTEQAEFWGMYSRKIYPFWDAQIGFRYDVKLEPTPYLVVGFEGLAPYFFETQVHLFISDKGDVSARIRQENDLLLTQRLILQPYLEADFYAQDVEAQAMGAGLSKLEVGAQTRYEITRKFAPYIDIRYERKFGKTVSLAKKHGEDVDNLSLGFGLRVMF